PGCRRPFPAGSASDARRPRAPANARLVLQLMAHTSVNGISLIGPRDLVNGSAPLREGAESPTPPSLGTVRFVAGTAQAIQTAHWHELLKEHPCAPKSIACWPAAPQRAQLRLRIGATPSVTAIVPISSRPPG